MFVMDYTYKFYYRCLPDDFKKKIIVFEYGQKSKIDRQAYPEPDSSFLLMNLCSNSNATIVIEQGGERQ